MTPLGVIFSTPPFEGGGGVIHEGELFFQCHLSTFYKMKSISNRCKTKIFRAKDETYSVRNELPGAFLEGGSYFFDVGAERGS